MTHVSIELPFARVATLTNGHVRRFVEDHSVSLRAIDATMLAKPARLPDGTPMLEFEGARIRYIGLRESEAGLGKLRERLERQCRYVVGYAARNGGRGRPQPRAEDVADDGMEAVRKAIASLERSTVVVEGWVADLVGPDTIDLRVMRDGRTEAMDHPDSQRLRGRAFDVPGGPWHPWNSFGLDRRDQAEAYGVELAQALTGLDAQAFRDAAYAPVEGGLAWRIEDAASARRIFGRFESGMPARSAAFVLEILRDLTGRLGRDAADAFLDLRDAHASDDAMAMVDAMRRLGRALAGSMPPEGFDAPAWLGYRVMGLSLAIRMEGLHQATDALGTDVSS